MTLRFLVISVAPLSEPEGKTGPVSRCETLRLAPVEQTNRILIHHGQFSHIHQVYTHFFSKKGLMWVKQCHKPSRSHHHFFIGGMFTIPKWVVCGIVLPLFL